MSLDTPQFRRAMEEADFLRQRLFKVFDQLEGETSASAIHCDYLHTMYALIDKEHSIYTRLKLIDTEEAQLMLEHLDANKIVDLLKDERTTIHNIYPKVKEELIELIKKVCGDDFDPEDFDIDDGESW